MTKIYLGNNINIKCIPKCCFSFTALKQIFITSSILIIKKSAFKYCYDLEKITFSKKTKLKKIDSFAFYECINLKAISLPNTIDTIPFKCFSFSGLEKMKFPGSIKYVGSMAFFNCKNLNEIVLNEGILELGDLSFSNNNLLKTINIPDSLKTIKPNAFYNCSKFTGLVIPENVIKINNAAFSYCTGFKGELKLSENLREIGVSAFLNCTNLSGNLNIPKFITIIQEKTLQH